MAVAISGITNDGIYFAGSPVVVRLSGLEWGSTVTSPFTIARVRVLDDGGKVAGDFRSDTGGQTEAVFDISTALRNILSAGTFDAEVAKATAAAKKPGGQGEAEGVSRIKKSFSLKITTEYLDSQDNEFTESECDLSVGASCINGGLTEMERLSGNTEATGWAGGNNRNGGASTKPTDAPEKVGKDSITSWVGLENIYYYPAGAAPQGDNISGNHAPIVLRDSIPYTDFLFVNRRGAVETCSALTLEEMSINVESKVYSRIGKPSFKPSRSLWAISSGGRRSWPMSSGYVTREWAEWWTMEFLMARQWWMYYEGSYVPVVVKPSKQSVSIYDRTKQQMPHVDFTVTLALEG